MGVVVECSWVQDVLRGIFCNDEGMIVVDEGKLGSDIGILVSHQGNLTPDLGNSVFNGKVIQFRK